MKLRFQQSARIADVEIIVSCHAPIGKESVLSKHLMEDFLKEEALALARKTKMKSDSLATKHTNNILAGGD